MQCTPTAILALLAALLALPGPAPSTLDACPGRPGWTKSPPEGLAGSTPVLPPVPLRKRPRCPAHAVIGLVEPAPSVEFEIGVIRPDPGMRYTIAVIDPRRCTCLTVRRDSEERGPRRGGRR